MNEKIKAFAAVSAAVLALNGAVSAAPADSHVTNVNAAAVDDCNDDWLTARGSRLYDMNGNEVWLTGANWFGMNCT